MGKHRPHPGDTELRLAGTHLGDADRIKRGRTGNKGPGCHPVAPLHPAPALYPAPLTSAVPGLPTLMRGTLPDCSLLPLTQTDCPGPAPAPGRTANREPVVSARHPVEGLWWVGAGRGLSPPERRWTHALHLLSWSSVVAQGWLFHVVVGAGHSPQAC